MDDLTGTFLPDMELPSATGGTLNLAKQARRWICFIYPYTGRPGVADPPGWDQIPGAHGSTPQAQAYASLHAELEKMSVSVCGLSTLSSEWQAEFRTRMNLPFALLSDADGAFLRALKLETFLAGDRRFLRRRTLVCESGKIIHDRRAITRPELDAVDCLTWLKANPR